MPLTILVVDDDLGTRLCVGDYLEISGYSVVKAENGQQALDLLEKSRPHLMITDIAMPEINGYDLVRQVRSRPIFRLLPVIFLTAHTSTEERVKGYNLGCDIYLPKPFELPELGAIVRSLLERSALIAQISPIFNQYSQTEKLSKSHYSEAVSQSVIANSKISLTEREQQVLSLLVNGLSNVQIGDRLHLSHRTIEKYVSSLFRKTNTNNRAELVRFTMENYLTN
ncbi:MULTISPECIES: response regulator transcription factor [Okeania]|uniref:DNA-binding response regulator n=1 Tax=Okeania hirsuta TaxID=1458930 RepID=A0A3N6Q1D3_9CYAN|nr:MULTISPECIES: response regulator transcription factor [Okeania]NEP72365.1 response regulator transcription factor [Okeania sp. SIO2G5]NEP93204.1 response regulator transcription factor [Okeania sp. SIO2F5]NEQ91225.1 response regulator transcription factor [Okeania sp. SIO2G4]NES90318.1 response regulator transcription factor [Okeania sp. SIO2B9]RQH23946.1 DNA-binding response regulator [Okeania hirsuta]